MDFALKGRQKIHAKVARVSGCLHAHSTAPLGRIFSIVPGVKTPGSVL